MLFSEVIILSNKFRVNDVAKRYGISKRTIKYYEEIGIMDCHREEGSNYRIYNTDSLNQLEKILVLRKLNFTLHEISEILDLDSIHAKGIFQEKLEEIQNEINRMTSLQRIIKSFLDMSNSLGIDNINIYQLLSEQVYIHSKVEREINMDNSRVEKIKIEIGKSLIIHADTIIADVKRLKEKFKEELQIEIPLIRIVDNESITESGYRILLKGNIKIERSFTEDSIKENLLVLGKDLEDIVTNNIKELVG